MKHEVTSYNTRKTLSKALKELIAEKDLSKISISEVASKAKVNRKTFYYHFDSINDLLFWTLDDGLSKVTKIFDLTADYDKTIHLALDSVEKSQGFMNNIINSDARGAFRDFLYQNLHEMSLKSIKDTLEREKVTLDEDYVKFVASFSTEALVGIIIQWISDPQEYSRAKIEEYLKHVFAKTQENLAKG